LENGGTAKDVPIIIIKSQPSSSGIGYYDSFGNKYGGLLILSQPHSNFFGKHSPKNTISGFIGPLQIYIFSSIFLISPSSRYLNSSDKYICLHLKIFYF